MTNPHLALVAPTTVIGTVGDRRSPPRRRRNAEVRAREYLTDGEIARLITAAGEEPPRPPRRHHGAGRLPARPAGGRAGHAALGRHRLRPWPPACRAGSRAAAESVHPLSGRELRALRRLKREQEPASPFIFTSERGAPFTTAGFRKMVARLGVAADFDFPVHPHMLRHACGFKLANDGVDTRSLQAYLGHKNIQHTVRYTELAPTRFKHFWRD